VFADNRRAEELTMETRLNIFENPVSVKFLKYFTRGYRVILESSLPAATRELVSLRASQINGCGFCVDMHTKEAAHEGETAVRLHLVAVWREATVFTEAERAALELTEQGTRIADGTGVTDEAWANAARHYDEDQLAALVSLIAFMNTVNRMNVITKTPGGDYQLGQLSAFG
jgi:AhpD family alkylhydroperoxidase